MYLPLQYHVRSTRSAAGGLFAQLPDDLQVDRPDAVDGLLELVLRLLLLGLIHLFTPGGLHVSGV